jgi:hypothetical protein
MKNDPGFQIFNSHTKPNRNLFSQLSVKFTFSEQDKKNIRNFGVSENCDGFTFAATFRQE